MSSFDSPSSVIGYINPHHCKVPDDAALETSIPMVKLNGFEQLAPCLMYSNRSDGGNDTVGCTDGYSYDAAGFDPNGGTITMQVGLYKVIVIVHLLC